MKIFHSFSSEETKRFGKEIAESAIDKLNNPARMKTALVIALRGDLGAGKTTFTQGFFRGLGMKKNPVSPTFVIMRRYKIPGLKPKVKSRFTDIYHFDAYRLKKAEDAEVLELGKILSDPGNIILIEWPEKIEGVLPRGVIRLDFVYGKKENERIIKLGSEPRMKIHFHAR
jgi:tRNA threonylcarbamoyladenosine biosynthesis protein TsaE